MSLILNRFTLFVIYLFNLGALLYTAPTVASCSLDDWVSTPGDSSLCHGYYLQQPLPFPGVSKELLSKLPATVTADQGQFTSEGNSTFTGHVHLIQGNSQLFADKATIHRDSSKPKPIDHVKAEGNVKITEPGLRVDGSTAELLTETHTKIIYNADYRLYDRHARGDANQITLYDNSKMVLKNATYTTCKPCQNLWWLKGERVSLNKKTGRGHARHTRLYLYKIPVFYFPYIDFPIDDRRQTGFLFPVFGNTNRSGIEFGVPFYWNLAPNYDATLTPRLFSKRGIELQGQFRYLFGQSKGTWEGSILPNDRAYRTFREKSLANHPFIPKNDPRILALNTSNTRKSFRAHHETSFNQHWSSNLQYHTVGDDNYFMDFAGNLGTASTVQLLQQGELLYNNEHWQINSRLQRYQTLHPFSGPVAQDVYARLPQLAAHSTYPDLPYGFVLKTAGEFTHFYHKKDPMTGSPFTQGNRVHLRPALSLPFITPGWYLKPRIQWDILSYSLALSPNDARILNAHSTRLLPIYDLDSGLIFERTLKIQEEPYLQTLEPRAYYLYVPYRNQNRLPVFDTGYPGFDYNQLYWDNRFTGLDRLGDANQVTLGLTSRFITEKTGSERLNLTAGQIFYFRNRNVTVCNPAINPLCVNQELPDGQQHRSAVVGLARFALEEYWSISAHIEWNTYENRTNKRAVSLQYHPNSSAVINLGYQFLRRNPAQIDPITGFPTPLDQTDVSFAWPLTEQWRLLGRWHYDLHNRYSDDISLGLEQHGCCTAVRLFASRFLQPFDSTRPNTGPLAGKRQYTNAIFLQFIFKGVAGVGHNKIDSTLRRSISGYEWRPSGF